MKNQFSLSVLPHTLSPLANGSYEVISYSFYYKKEPAFKKWLSIKVKLVCEEIRNVKLPYTEEVEKNFKIFKRIFLENQPVYVQFNNLRICSYKLNSSSGITLYASSFSIFKE